MHNLVITKSIFIEAFIHLWFSKHSFTQKRQIIARVFDQFAKRRKKFGWLYHINNTAM